MNDVIVALTNLFQQILAQCFGCHFSNFSFHVESDMKEDRNEARKIKVSNMQIRFNPT